MNEADIQRINELARKSKTVEGLTEAELAEQAALRKAYIASVKRNLKTQLDNIDIKEADGSITHVKDIPKNKRSEYIQIRLHDNFRIKESTSEGDSCKAQESF